MSAESMIAASHRGSTDFPSSPRMTSESPRTSNPHDPKARGGDELHLAGRTSPGETVPSRVVQEPSREVVARSTRTWVVC